MAEKLIVIVGITGNQGASVAEKFINAPGYKLRGLTRDPSKPNAKKWTDRGVEMVAGDLDTLEAVKSAFKGANVIFGTTDFWQYFGMPSTAETAKKEGRTPNEVAFDIEVRQGKNIVDAAAATIDTLDRLVLSTLSDAKKWSKGAVTWNYHFDGKWAAVQYLKEKHPDLYAKASTVQLGLFMTNFLGPGINAPQKQRDGTFLLNLPVRPKRPIPMVQPQLDTGSFVHALVEAPPGKNLLGCGSFLSLADWCERWGKFNNVTCNYKQIPEKVLWDILPGTFGNEVGAMYTYMSEYGYDGSDPSVILPQDLGVDVKVTSIEEFFKLTDWSKILNAAPKE